MLLVSLALASSNYPGEIATALGTPCSPVCTVCHATASGGAGTVTQAFGLAMQDHGLEGGGQSDLLTTALSACGDDGVDSDGDGELDVDELAGGVDPNPDGVAFCDVVTPQYGCFSHAPAPVGFWLAGIGLVALRRRARADQP